MPPTLPPSPSSKSTWNVGSGLEQALLAAWGGAGVRGCKRPQTESQGPGPAQPYLGLCMRPGADHLGAPTFPAEWGFGVNVLSEGCDVAFRESCVSDLWNSEKSILYYSRLLKFCNIISVLPPGMGPADISPLKIALSDHPSCQLSFPPFSPSTLGTASLKHSPSEHLAGGAVIHAPPAGFVASLPARVCKTFLASLCSQD